MSWQDYLMGMKLIRLEQRSQIIVYAVTLARLFAYDDNGLVYSLQHTQV